jgi:hypothetical protein
MDLPHFQGFTNQNGGAVLKDRLPTREEQFTVEDAAG